MTRTNTVEIGEYIVTGTTRFAFEDDSFSHAFGVCKVMTPYPESVELEEAYKGDDVVDVMDLPAYIKEEAERLLMKVRS